MSGTDTGNTLLRNLLEGEKNALHNREMHVSGKFVIEDDPIKQEGSDYEYDRDKKNRHNKA